VDSDRATQLAASYLQRKRIGFSKPARAEKIDSTTIEVVFVAPGALDPNMVVDPPDVRVRVNIDTQEMELVPQM
jgi:hypothetical protein